MSDFDSYKQLVRDRFDFLDYLKGFIREFAERGASWVGFSPFVQETRPSFNYWPDSGRWRDFAGCSNLGGDSFQFLMDFHHVTFPEALRMAATIANVAPPAGHDHWKEVVSRELRAREVFRIHREYAGRCQEAMTPDRYAWLERKWGTKPDFAREKCIGYTKGDHARYFIEERKEPRDLLLQTGLFVPQRCDLISAAIRGRVDEYENGGLLTDLFVNRFMLPHFLDGHIRFFAARSDDPEAALGKKFLKCLVHSKSNSFVSESVVNIPYGLDSVRGVAVVLLLEGYGDLLAALQAGFAAFALGTIHISRRNIQLILGALRKCRKLIICFDSEANSSGFKGALDTAKLLHRLGINVFIALLPRSDGVSKVDVADYLIDHTKEEFQAILDTAKPYIDVLLDRVPADTTKLELEAKLADVLDAIAYLGEMPREHYVGVLHERYDLPKPLVRKLVKAALEKVAANAKRTAVVPDDDQDADDETAATTGAAASPAATPPPNSSPSAGASASTAAVSVASATSAASSGASATSVASSGAASSSAKGVAPAAAQADERLPWEGDTDEPAASTVNELTFRDPVQEDHRHFYYHVVPAGMTKEGKTKFKPEPISNFVLRAVERIWSPSGELLVVDTFVHGGQVYRDLTLPVSVFKTSRDLKQALRRADLAWLGTDGQAQQVLYKLSRQCRRRRDGVGTIGYVETSDGRLWVGPNAVVIRTVWEPDEVDDVIFTPSGSQLERRVRYEHADAEVVRDLARRVLPALLRLNRLRTILPIAAWFVATLFAPRLREMYGMFPVLVCWGTKGTGKTSLIAQVFWPIFGITRHEPFAASDTRFAFLRLLSSTASVAVVVDEYKPRDLKEDQVLFINRLVRQVTGGEEANRGRSDKGVDGYLLVAPLCIIGEQRPEHDAAIADRIVSVQPDANALVDNPEFVSTFERVRREKLGLLAVPLVEFALGRDVRTEFEAARADADPVIDRLPGAENITSRCRFNMHVVAFGLRVFRAFADSMGIALPKYDLREAFVSTLSDVMDGSGGGRSALDEFVETCSFLATLPDQQAGSLIEFIHYKFVNGLLFIHVEAAFELVLAHWRRTGRTPAANEVRVIKKLAKESMRGLRYIRKVGHSISMDKGLRPRCIGIDLVEAANVIDVSGFGRHIESVRVDDENTEDEPAFRKGIYLALA